MGGGNEYGEKRGRRRQTYKNPVKSWERRKTFFSFSFTMAWTALVACRGPLVSTFNGLRPASGTRAAASGKLNSPAESNAIIVSACKLWNVYHAELVNMKNRRQLKSFVTKVVWKSIPI